jgi:membrane protease YdiL (CAAX protease family)
MIRGFIRNHPLAAFFVLAYGFSWTLGLPRLAGWVTGFPVEILVGGMGPTLAAVAVTGVTEGRGGVRNLLAGALRWRVRLRWWAFSLLGFPALMLAAIAVSQMAGYPVEWNRPDLPARGMLAIVGLGVLFSALLEEIGWRGYAWPELLKRHRFLVAALILGSFWACWHLPLFFIKGMSQEKLSFVPYLAIVIGIAVWLGWLYCRTRSVLLAAVFHASANCAWVFPGSQSKPVLALLAGLGFLLTVCLLLFSPTCRNGRNPWSLISCRANI